MLRQRIITITAKDVIKGDDISFNNDFWKIEKILDEDGKLVFQIKRDNLFSTDIQSNLITIRKLEYDKKIEVRRNINLVEYLFGLIFK